MYICCSGGHFVQRSGTILAILVKIKAKEEHFCEIESCFCNFGIGPYNNFSKEAYEEHKSGRFFIDSP